MIDIQAERVIPLATAARRHVGDVDPSTLWRWHKRGVRGVRLEVVKIGGRVFTTAEAIARFTAALSAEPATAPAPSVDRRQQLNAADRVLDAAGI